jgi:hypothetical protein
MEDDRQSCVPFPLVRWDFLWVLLHRFDVALDHAVCLRVQGCGACLAHSQALTNLPYQTGLKVTALLCSSGGTPKQQKKLVASASATVEAS